MNLFTVQFNAALSAHIGRSNKINSTEIVAFINAVTIMIAVMITRNMKYDFAAADESANLCPGKIQGVFIGIMLVKKVPREKHPVDAIVYFQAIVNHICKTVLNIFPALLLLCRIIEECAAQSQMYVGKVNKAYHGKLNLW